MGNPPLQLSRAVVSLERMVGKLIRASSLYESEPWGVSKQDVYCNQVVELETPLWPLAVLGKLQEIERMAGRERKNRWDSRTLDLDLLLYGTLFFEMPDLIVPHPRMAVRNFVLHPLAEIAPELIHPVYRKTFKKLSELSPDTGWTKRCEYS